MALELRQSLKLSQQLVMTPQLQQAIKLLQLSSLELQQAVREELEVNPTLEEVVEEVPEAPGGEDGRPYYETLLPRKPSLSEYLETQICLSDADGALREIAPYLIGNIDENGYLKGSAEETAEALGKPLEEVERAIAKIPTLDPAGLGARDLRDCLMIQAREKGEEFSLPLQILTDHFDLFTRGDIAGIAKRLKLPREIVREAFQKLVTLWPKPGRLFSGDDVHYIPPAAYGAPDDTPWRGTRNG